MEDTTFKNRTENFKGHIAINENKEVFYIPEGESVELKAMRVLNGKEFKVIDLEKVSGDAVKHFILI